MTTLQEPTMRTVDRRDLHLEIQPPDERPISPPRLPTRSRWPIWLGGAAALLALAISLGIHSRRQADERLTQVAEQAAVQVVNVTSPKPGAAAEEIALPGNTLAFNDTPIYARASGYLKKWHVDIGARVRAGDLLAEIEVPELDQQLHQAQADLETAQTNLELAKITNTRWQNLLVQRVVSSQEADQVKSDFGVKQAALLASAANVRRLEETQKYERVIAPFDGIITARGTDIGALVEPGASATGHELFHLSAVQQLRVYVAVPEVYADSVVDGSKVTLTLSSNATRSFAGTVVRNANAIDLTTRTLNVEVDVDNRDGRLLPGAYVIVHFKLSESSGSVTIPSNALLFRGEGLRVAKVVKGAVSLALVTIGHDFGSTVEVTSGLSPQDVIVLDPSDSLADGAQVEVSESGKSAVIK